MSDKLLSMPKYVPAGQTTQMVVGAHQESDQDVLFMADKHYKNLNSNVSIFRVISQLILKIIICPHCCTAIIEETDSIKVTG